MLIVIAFVELRVLRVPLHKRDQIGSEAMPDSTMIYVTHDQVEAMTLASRIVVLANKGIAQVGTPLELYETPRSEFVARFFGSHAMNLLPGKITGTGAMTEITLDTGGIARSTVPTTDADMGITVNIGIRPEDFQQTDGDAIFHGTVQIAEALGEVTLIYFDAVLGDDPVIGKLPGIHREARGSDIRLTAPPEKVHLFHNGMLVLVLLPPWLARSRWRRKIHYRCHRARSCLRYPGA